MILDEEGIYDPSIFNDRFLLGLKGAMSEAELFVMRARLQGGIRNYARRGALKLTLPIGLCYTEGNVIVLDPDRAACKLPFVRSFAAFTTQGLPSRLFVTFTENICFFLGAFVVGHGKREMVWGEVQHHDVLRVLHQPAYAGAYVFGRTRTTKSADGKVYIAEVPRTQWDTLVKNAQVGYISLRGVREK